MLFIQLNLISVLFFLPWLSSKRCCFNRHMLRINMSRIGSSWIYFRVPFLHVELKIFGLATPQTSWKKTSDQLNAHFMCRSHPEKNSTSFYLVVLIKCIISFQLFSDLALFIHTDQTNLTPNCVPTPFYFKFNFWIHFSCHR